VSEQNDESWDNSFLRSTGPISFRGEFAVNPDTREPDYKAIFDYASQPKETLTNCDLCGTSDLITSIEEDRFGYLVHISHCKRCGLIFLNPRMTAASYDAFYAGPYRALVSAFHRRPINAMTMEAEQRDYALKLGNALDQYIHCDSSGRLLDIGGSTGVVAEAICRRFYYQGTVVDPCIEELNRAADKGLRTLLGTAETFRRNELFDLVLMCQTVDHLLSPTMALRKIHSAMTENGVLFVDILDYDQTHIIKIDHPYSLTSRTMIQYLWQNGFAVGEPLHMDNKHVGFVALPMRKL
jgi:SAM-dependent methyltransferase